MSATGTPAPDDYPPAYWLDRERRERERRLEMLNRVAYLVGWYGSVAERTGDADLAELVTELRKAIDLPDRS